MRKHLGASEGMLTEQDRDLLALLAAGTTDEIMARPFGWSASDRTASCAQDHDPSERGDAFPGGP